MIITDTTGGVLATLYPLLIGASIVYTTSIATCINIYSIMRHAHNIINFLYIQF